MKKIILAKKILAVAKKIVESAPSTFHELEDWDVGPDNRNPYAAPETRSMVASGIIVGNGKSVTTSRIVKYDPDTESITTSSGSTYVLPLASVDPEWENFCKKNGTSPRAVLMKFYSKVNDSTDTEEESQPYHPQRQYRSEEWYEKRGEPYDPEKTAIRLADALHSAAHRNPDWEMVDIRILYGDFFGNNISKLLHELKDNPLKYFNLNVDEVFSCALGGFFVDSPGMSVNFIKSGKLDDLCMNSSGTSLSFMCQSFILPNLTKVRTKYPEVISSFLSRPVINKILNTSLGKKWFFFILTDENLKDPNIIKNLDKKVFIESLFSEAGNEWLKSGTGKKWSQSPEGKEILKSGLSTRSKKNL